MASAGGRSRSRLSSSAHRPPVHDGGGGTSSSASNRAFRVAVPPHPVRRGPGTRRRVSPRGSSRGSCATGLGRRLTDISSFLLLGPEAPDGLSWPGFPAHAVPSSPCPRPGSPMQRASPPHRMTVRHLPHTAGGVLCDVFMFPLAHMTKANNAE